MPTLEDFLTKFGAPSESGVGPSSMPAPQAPSFDGMDLTPEFNPAIRSPEMHIQRTEQYVPMIEAAAAEFGIDPIELRARILQESQGNPRAVSPAGAMGLSQFMPATWAEEMGDADPFDPQANIRAGAKYYRKLLDQFDGDRHKAWAAYNWGPGNVRRNWPNMPEETRNYLKHLPGWMQKLGGDPGASPVLSPERQSGLGLEDYLDMFGDTQAPPSFGSTPPDLQFTGAAPGDATSLDLGAVEQQRQQQRLVDADAERGEAFLAAAAERGAGGLGFTPERFGAEQAGEDQSLLGKAWNFPASATDYILGPLAAGIKGQGFTQYLGERARLSEEGHANKAIRAELEKRMGALSEEERVKLTEGAVEKLRENPDAALHDKEKLALATNPGFVASIKQLGQMMVEQPGTLAKEIGSAMIKDLPYFMFAGEGVAAAAGALARTNKALQASRAAQALGRSPIARGALEEAAGGVLVGKPSAESAGQDYGAPDLFVDVLAGAAIGGGAQAIQKPNRPSQMYREPVGPEDVSRLYGEPVGPQAVSRQYEQPAGPPRTYRPEEELAQMARSAPQERPQLPRGRPGSEDPWAGIEDMDPRNRPTGELIDFTPPKPKEAAPAELAEPPEVQGRSELETVSEGDDPSLDEPWETVRPEEVASPTYEPDLNKKSRQILGTKHGLHAIYDPSKKDKPFIIRQVGSDKELWSGRTNRAMGRNMELLATRGPKPKEAPRASQIVRAMGPFKVDEWWLRQLGYKTPAAANKNLGGRLFVGENAKDGVSIPEAYESVKEMLNAGELFLPGVKDPADFAEVDFIDYLTGRADASQPYTNPQGELVDETGRVLFDRQSPQAAGQAEAPAAPSAAKIPETAPPLEQYNGPQLTFDERIIESLSKPAKIGPVQRVDQKAAASWRKMQESINSGLPPDEVKSWNKSFQSQDYPEGLKKPEYGFDREIFEATKRIGSSTRFEKMSPSVLGYWQKVKNADAKPGAMGKIAVSDVRNVLTVAHEFGHALDFWLHKSGMGMDNAAKFGLPKSASKEIFEELRNVSYKVRGEPASDMIDYRHSPEELFADYAAMYVLDPQQAKRMAPKASGHFEKRIQGTDAKKLIDELHQNNVEPSVRPIKGETETPVEPPGSIAFAKPREAARDLKLRESAQSLVKKVIRDKRANIAKHFEIASEWQRRLSEKKLEEIGAAVEGIGVLRNKGDSGEAVKARLDDEQKKVLKEYRFYQELSRQNVNKYLEKLGEEEYIKFIDDYIPHFYVKTKKQNVSSGLSRWTRNSPNAKARKLPTLKEAADLGLIPITQNVAKLHKMWADVNWRVATNRAFLQGLRELKTEDGGPAIRALADAPEGWKKIDHPAIVRTFQGRDWAGGAAIHPDAHGPAKMILENLFSNKFVKGLEGFNAYAKKVSLSLSFFHHFALTESAQAVLARGKNPLRGVLLIGENGKILQMPHKRGLAFMRDPDFLEDAAGHGLVFGHSSDTPIGRIGRDLESAEAWLRSNNLPILHVPFRMLRKANEKWDSLLWDHYHNGIKAFAYEDLTREMLMRYPNAYPPKIKETVAEFVNDAFGGQEWETKFWLTPQMRQIAHLAFLAPDWTLSNANVAIKSLSRDPIRRKMQLTYWRNMALTLAGSAIAMQAAIFRIWGDEEKGDHMWMWDNEHGQKSGHIDVTPMLRALGDKFPGMPELPEGERRYVHFGKQAREVIGWVTDPLLTSTRKSAPAIQTALEQLTSSQVGSSGFDMPWVGKDLYPSLPQRVGSVAAKFKPFSFGDNNFAFTAPMRKGMTKWKAGKGYEEALKGYADPAIWKVVGKREDFVPKLESLAEEITAAAKANGLDADHVFKGAVSRVRGEYAKKFFKALNEKDEGAMERYARALNRLHWTAKNINTSAKGRMIKMSRDDRKIVHELMKEARMESRKKK